MAKRLKGNNRILLGLALTFCLIGCGLIGDWQAINGDTCSVNTTSLNTSLLECNGDINGTAIYNLTSDLKLSERDCCEAQSTPIHPCFWNPHSRVSGEYCNTCRKECLSLTTALNFHQFNVGVFLVAVGSILGYVITIAVASDIASVENQVTTVVFLCRVHFSM